MMGGYVYTSKFDYKSSRLYLYTMITYYLDNISLLLSYPFPLQYTVNTILNLVYIILYVYLYFYYYAYVHNFFKSQSLHVGKNSILFYYFAFAKVPLK